MNRTALAGAALLTLGAGGYFAYDEYSSQKKADEARAAAEKKDAERRNAPKPKKKQSLSAPDLKGSTEDDARRDLTKLGLELEVTDMGCEQPDDTKMMPVGQICGQKPPPGTSVLEGTSIRVAIERDTYEHGGVGTTSEWRRMPDLAGMSYEAALSHLSSKGFGSDEFIVSNDMHCPPGQVCGSTPEPGERKIKARAGTLYVGK